jgi:hypothetical protein
MYVNSTTEQLPQFILNDRQRICDYKTYILVDIFL